jgi:hypothetical protein
MKVAHIVDRQEVLMLIDLIEAPFVPVESKLKAVKRLEYITGRDIPGTKMFRKIRDEYLSGGDVDTLTEKEMALFGAEKPKVARTRAVQGVGKGGGRHQ